MLQAFHIDRHEPSGNRELALRGNDALLIARPTGSHVLSARVDKPYAKPGDQVTLDLLVYPGPPGTPQAQVYWFPLVCVNPVRDLYYACFAQFAGVPDDEVHAIVAGNAARVFGFDVAALAGVDVGAGADAGAR